MNKFEFITIIISSLTFIFFGLNFLYQFLQYKKQNRLSAISSLLNSAQEISKRLDRSGDTEDKELNQKLAKNITRYCKELMEIIK